jgi:hypothetical protein
MWMWTCLLAPAQYRRNLIRAIVMWRLPPFLNEPPSTSEIPYPDLVEKSDTRGIYNVSAGRQFVDPPGLINGFLSCQFCSNCYDIQTQEPVVGL